MRNRSRPAGAPRSALSRALGLAGIVLLASACTAAGAADASAPGDAATPAERAASRDVAGREATSADNPPTTGETIDCRIAGDGKTTLVFVNRCPESLSYAGSDIAAGTLEPGAFRCVDIGNATDPIASKRYWGWVGDDPGPERHTLAEFTFNSDFQHFDWYDISHVDAFNLPMQIVPVAHSECRTLTCAMDLLVGCPAVGQYRDASGNAVACVSPNRDDPASPVVQHFETCDDAYAWSGDDANGTDPSPMRACAGEDWDIVFCPAGDS